MSREKYFKTFFLIYIPNPEKYLAGDAGKDLPPPINTAQGGFRRRLLRGIGKRASILRPPPWRCTREIGFISRMNPLPARGG
jgi:hypothetical protein